MLTFPIRCHEMPYSICRKISLKMRCTNRREVSSTLLVLQAGLWHPKGESLIMGCTILMNKIVNNTQYLTL